MAVGRPARQPGTAQGFVDGPGALVHRKDSSAAHQSGSDSGTEGTASDWLGGSFGSGGSSDGGGPAAPPADCWDARQLWGGSSSNTEVDRASGTSGLWQHGGDDDAVAWARRLLAAPQPHSPPPPSPPRVPCSDTGRTPSSKRVCSEGGSAGFGGGSGGFINSGTGITWGRVRAAVKELTARVTEAEAALEGQRDAARREEDALRARITLLEGRLRTAESRIMPACPTRPGERAAAVGGSCSAGCEAAGAGREKQQQPGPACRRAAEVATATPPCLV